ncbi:protein-tyrosine phosphatase-like protein [Yarrowia lipolytica]|nr:protein-tyrosine phosphatase-like protein [Yarrowia lipolytica]RDW51491.1 protein-tyrosine phosphatase-like protein [Yarrowia lipolytica]
MVAQLVSYYLRAAVASPKLLYDHGMPNGEVLDMAYLTDELLISAGPTNDYRRSFYRPATAELKQYLDSNHKDGWLVYNFRAEPSGYEDSDLDNRVVHLPFRDHTPPPFFYIPLFIESIRDHVGGANPAKRTPPSTPPRAPSSDSVDTDTSTRPLAPSQSSLLEGISSDPSLVPTTDVSSLQLWERSDSGRSHSSGSDDTSLASQMSVNSQMSQVSQASSQSQISRISGSLQSSIGSTVSAPRVAVLHCKAGKGRSGLMGCAFLVAERGWSVKNAADSFTRVRMRPGFGEGVSIQSQKRYLNYTYDWAQVIARQYRDIKVDLDYIRVWKPQYSDIVITLSDYENDSDRAEYSPSAIPEVKKRYISSPEDLTNQTDDYITFRPKETVSLTGDCRVKVKHVVANPFSLPLVDGQGDAWFNLFFETFRVREGAYDFHNTEGMFSVSWSHMDGFRGNFQKGMWLCERVEVGWRVAQSQEGTAQES